MGNHVAMGHAVNCFQDGAEYLGCAHKSLKFESTAKAVMNLHGIESWNAKALVQETLSRQAELASRSPLRNIKVEEGLDFIKKELAKGFGPLGLRHPNGGFTAPSLSMCTAAVTGGVNMTRDQFAYVCWEMLNTVKDYRGYRLEPRSKDREILYEVFDAMDIDRSGVLSTGEWAGGCSVFFRGNTDECVRAVFKILDQDHSETLTHPELREYLKPFIKAMIPESAAALQPMLLKRATDLIFQDMDKDNSHTISAQEMLQWTHEGKNIIDSLATLIDKEVYRLYMENKKDQDRRAYNSFGAMGTSTGGKYGQQQQGGANGPMSSGMGGSQQGGGPMGSQQNMFGTGGPLDPTMGYPPQSGGGDRGWGGAMQSGSWGQSQQGGWGGSPSASQSGWGMGGGAPPPNSTGGGGPCGSWAGGPPQDGSWAGGSGMGFGGAWGGADSGGASPGAAWGQQQTGAFGTGSSPTSARGSEHHFASTASHWSNVPPPPPPPTRGAPPRPQEPGGGAPGAGPLQSSPPYNPGGASYDPAWGGRGAWR